MSTALKKHLFDAYKGFSDKRIKNLNKGNTFIIDDRSPKDIDSKGGLYSYFCQIFITANENEMCQLTLQGNVPVNASVEQYIQSCNGTMSKDIHSRISIIFSPKDTSILREIAQLIENITRPGAKYDVPSYKYVCPRTAASLRNLADCLDSFYSCSELQTGRAETANSVILKPQ